MPRYVRPQLAAQMMGVTPSTATAYAKRGLLPYVETPGGQVRIDVDAIPELMSRRKRASSTVTVIESSQ